MVRGFIITAALVGMVATAHAQSGRPPADRGEGRVPAPIQQTAPHTISGATKGTVERFPSIVAPSVVAVLRPAPQTRWKVDPTLLQQPLQTRGAANTRTTSQTNQQSQIQTPSNLQVAISPQAVADKIAARIQTVFKGDSLGYSFTVMMPGGESASANDGFARHYVDGPSKSWTADLPISVASVSKSITAAAVLRVVTERGLSLDIPAWTLLPSDWTYSTGFKTITVRQLLAHTSGIRGCNITHDALEACAAGAIMMMNKGTGPDYGVRYNNANYAFLRIILTRIADDSIPTTPLQIGLRYYALTNQHVVGINGPAGMGGATCAALPDDPPLSYISTTDDMVLGSTAAVNYNWIDLQPGNDWGDMTEICGSQGWNLSSRQLARFANALMVNHKIVPRGTVELMQKELLGLQYYDFGEGLTAYGHGGYHPGPWNRGEVNTAMMTFNNGVSVGLVINSRFRNGDQLEVVAEAVRRGWWN